MIKPNTTFDDLPGGLKRERKGYLLTDVPHRLLVKTVRKVARESQMPVAGELMHLTRGGEALLYVARLDVKGVSRPKGLRYSLCVVNANDTLMRLRAFGALSDEHGAGYVSYADALTASHSPKLDLDALAESWLDTLYTRAGEVASEARTLRRLKVKPGAARSLLTRCARRRREEYALPWSRVGKTLALFEHTNHSALSLLRSQAAACASVSRQSAYAFDVCLSVKERLNAYSQSRRDGRTLR